MAQLVTMPQMGYEMVDGTIVRWLKAEGDPVQTGEVIAEVETDKAIVELEANADGVLSGLAPAGSLAPVGAVIGSIGAASEAPNPPTAPARAPRRVSPIAARRGRAAPPDKGMRAGFPPRVPNADGKIMLGAMGKAIARRTASTMSAVPHFYMSISIDMTDAAAYRREVNRSLKNNDRVSMNDVMMKAATLTLLKYPVFNATFEGDHLRVHPNVHMGIAVALADGLMVPAVLECERKSLIEIARGAKDVARRAVDGTLQQAEYSGTFTISNLGMFGVDGFTIVIVAPQVAILGVPAIKPTPVVGGGVVVVRQMVTVTLGTDHRAAQGAEAAQFLVELKRILEDPQLLG